MKFNLFYKSVDMVNKLSQYHLSIIVNGQKILIYLYN